PPIVRRLAFASVGLVLLQILLGVGTWLTKYSVPYWFSGWIEPAGSSITAGGWFQSLTATAHVAGGSLLLAIALAMSLYEGRSIIGGFSASKRLALSNAFAGRALA